MRYDSSTHTDLTDEELIQLVQTGDELAFAQLAARHSFRIWQLVVLNSRQTRDAEEIFQDIWVSVWENIGNLREVRSFGAWLSKIAYTACRRYYTPKSHTGGEILQSTEKLAETIDRDVIAHFREAELRAEVTEAVHHLPEKVRTVAVRYYLEMWTVKEIAEELDLAVGTVKTRLRDIRTLLRKEFDVEEVERGRIVPREKEISEPSREKIRGDFEMKLTFERDELSIGGETLRDVIRKTEYAASTEEEVRPFLNGLYFNFLEDRMEVVATDGKRLALVQCDPPNPRVKTNGFIVPLKAVKEIPRTFPESIEVDISIFENEICFTDGNATLTTQLVDREYPNYQKIIRESSKGKTVVSKDQILSVAQRMALLANPKKAYPICLEIGTECIRVSTRTPELTEADETVPVASGTGSVRIGFDARLLIDALAHIDAESVSIEFLEELNPVLIKPIDDDRHISLVMPLLLERYA